MAVRVNGDGNMLPEKATEVNGSEYQVDSYKPNRMECRVDSPPAVVFDEAVAPVGTDRADCASRSRKRGLNTSR